MTGYYEALSIGPSHNYYFGRASADVTGFVAYFCLGMSGAFAAVRAQAIQAARRGAEDHSPCTTAVLCRGWLSGGLLSLQDPSRKSRSYRLGPEYERLVTEGT